MTLADIDSDKRVNYTAVLVLASSRMTPGLPVSVSLKAVQAAVGRRSDLDSDKRANRTARSVPPSPLEHIRVVSSRSLKATGKPSD